MQAGAVDVSLDGIYAVGAEQSHTEALDRPADDDDDVDDDNDKPSS